MFGKDKLQAEDGALLTEVERLEALPAIQLATEVMMKGFAAGGPADSAPPVAPVVTIREIRKGFDPGGSDDALNRRLYDLVADSVQMLEHASLVRPEGTKGIQQGLVAYSLTRLGRTARDNDAVERVLRGG